VTATTTSDALTPQERLDLDAAQGDNRVKYAIDRTFAASLSAIVLGTTAAVLTAAGQPGAPLAGQFWIVPVVGGITAIAALVRSQYVDKA
jgi:hypothetical protein